LPLTVYYWGDQIEKNEVDLMCRARGGKKKCIYNFGGKPEVKRGLGRTKHRWEDNIKMDLREVG
jgi:hypothetical protein